MMFKRFSQFGPLGLLLVLGFSACSQEAETAPNTGLEQDASEGGVALQEGAEAEIQAPEDVITAEPDGGMGDHTDPIPNSKEAETAMGSGGGSGGSDASSAPPTDANTGQAHGFSEPEGGGVDSDVLQAAGDMGSDEIQAEEAPRVLAGTRVSLVSDIELSTEEALEGDPVIATVTEDILAPDGMVLIPQGARMLGRVVRVLPSLDSETDPVLEFVFETISTVDEEWAIYATVIDIEMEVERKDSDRRTAAKVGGAAVAGALLGRLLGGDKGDAAKGAAGGAVVGTVVAMETRQGHAKVLVGAAMVVELREVLILD